VFGQQQQLIFQFQLNESKDLYQSFQIADKDATGQKWFLTDV